MFVGLAFRICDGRRELLRGPNFYHLLKSPLQYTIVAIGKIRLEVFIRVIRSILNGCHSIRLYFLSVKFRIRVATGHTRAGSVSHGSVEYRLFDLSG